MEDAEQHAPVSCREQIDLLRDRMGNPFKFGVVGATDSHTGLSTTREDNNFGKVSVMEPSNDRLAAVFTS